MAIQHDKTIRNNDLDLQSKNEEMKTIEDYLQLQVATLRNES